MTIELKKLQLITEIALLTTREEVRKIALGMDIQESYEDLLKMI